MQPFGPWLPDRSEHAAGGEPFLTVATNVIPAEAGHYGPMPSIEAFSAALSGRPCGVVAGRGASGQAFAYAGTDDDLFILSSGGTWASRAKAGGYALGGAQRWRFLQFGDSLIAIPGLGEAIQAVNVSVSSNAFADLSGDAPEAVYGATVRDFVVVGYTSDDTNGQRSDRVQWCGIGDPTSWPTPGTAAAATAQSDENFLPDSGEMTGIVSGVGGADAAVFFDQGVWRVQYEGPPTIFRFDRVVRDRGCKIPGSLIGVGGIAYFWAEDGWYAYNGSGIAPIGAGQVDQFFRRDLSPANAANVWAAADTSRKLVYWAYPSVNASSGAPDRLLIYNYVVGRWALADIDTLALGTTASPGYSLEDLDAFGTLDSLPASLDSPLWSGSVTYTGIIDGDGRLGQFGGGALEAVMVASEVRPTDGRRVFLQGVRPFVDARGVQVAIDQRSDEYSDPIMGTFRPVGVDGFAPFRADCRGFRVRVKVPAAATWTKGAGYLPRMTAGGWR